ncbi:hypothetical protein V2J09_016311 [Rumex salicifolius]
MSLLEISEICFICSHVIIFGDILVRRSPLEIDVLGWRFHVRDNKGSTTQHKPYTNQLLLFLDCPSSDTSTSSSEKECKRHTLMSHLHMKVTNS